MVAAVEHRLDQVPEVADAERDVDDPALHQLVDGDLDDRAVSERHQRLREDGGVRLEPATTTAGEHDRPDTQIPVDP